MISKINNQDDQAAFHNGPNIDENRTISAPSNKKNKRNPSLSTSCLAVHHESRITCSPQMNQARGNRFSLSSFSQSLFFSVY